MMSVVMLMGRWADWIHAMRWRYCSLLYSRCMAASMRVEPLCHPQMHVVAKRGHGIDGFDDVRRKVTRMGRGEAYPANARNLAHSG